MKRVSFVCMLVMVSVLFMAGTASAQVAFGEQSQRNGQEPLVRSEKAPVQVPGSSLTATGEMAPIKATPAPDIQTKEVPVEKQSTAAIAPEQSTKYHGPATMPTWYTPSMVTVTLLMEGFENGGALPAGWTDSPGTSPWLYNGGTDHGPGSVHGGSYAAYFNICDYSSGTKDSLITPSMDFSTPSGSYILSYWGWHSSGTDSVVIYLSEAGVMTRLQKMPNTAAWAQSGVHFSSTSTDGKIYFIGYSNYGSYNLYIDDVSINDVPNTGRCCYGNPFAPSCADNTQDECNALGGTWSLDSNCTNNPCPVIPPMLPSFTNCPSVMVSEFAGATFSYLFSAENPLPDTLTYSLLSGRGSINDSTGLYSVAIDSTERDTISAVVVACNGIGCDTCAFQIEVYPILPGPGPLVVAGFPRIWAIHNIPDVDYAIFPRGCDILTTQDSVVAVIYLKNISSTELDSVRVVMEPIDPGFQILNGAIDYGNIPPGSSTPRAFNIVTSGAEIGTHPILLHISSNSENFDYTTWLSTWETNISILDTVGGVIEGNLITPFGETDLHITAPEDTTYFPYFFDLSQLNATLYSTYPFYGTQCYLALEVIQNQVVPPAPLCTFTKRAYMKDPNGPPDIAIESAGLDVWSANGVPAGCDFTDGNGIAEVRVPPGTYTYQLRPPPKLRKYFGNGVGSVELVAGQNITVTNTYPYIPAAIPLLTGAPPPNGEGQSGNDADVQDNATKSLVVDVGVSIALHIADDALGPFSFFVSMLSKVGATLVGNAVGNIFDPTQTDMYYAARAATPPASDSELTYQENISYSDIHFNGVPNFSTGYSLSASWHYERMTNIHTYAWDSTATFWIENYLPIQLQTNANEYSIGDTCTISASITNSASEMLMGGQVVAYSWLVSNDMSQAFNQMIMADDGQAPDSVANDGIYSGNLPLDVPLVGEYKIVVIAARSGYKNDENPPSLGFASATISIGGPPPCIYLTGDINGDGLRGGGDVTYGVRYFKLIGHNPPDSCYDDAVPTPSHWLYVAGDVNGNCEFRGSDITRLVAYFKLIAPLQYCHLFPPLPMKGDNGDLSPNPER